MTLSSSRPGRFRFGSEPASERARQVRNGLAFVQLNSWARAAAVAITRQSQMDKVVRPNSRAPHFFLCFFTLYLQTQIGH